MSETLATHSSLRVYKTFTSGSNHFVKLFTVVFPCEWFTSYCGISLTRFLDVTYLSLAMHHVSPVERWSWNGWIRLVVRLA